MQGGCPDRNELDDFEFQAITSVLKALRIISSVLFSHYNAQQRAIEKIRVDILLYMASVQTGTPKYKTKMLQMVKQRREGLGFKPIGQLIDYTRLTLRGRIPRKTISQEGLQHAQVLRRHDYRYEPGQIYDPQVEGSAAGARRRARQEEERREQDVSRKN
ncbi:hypothetical protein BDF14DRAFT_1878373 [Spinellus fusiger]|nr:hypothetical protein BDF14DRAFT_1878373 [Spinellus fusiger]